MMKTEKKVMVGNAIEYCVFSMFLITAVQNTNISNDNGGMVNSIIHKTEEFCRQI